MQYIVSAMFLMQYTVLSLHWFITLVFVERIRLCVVTLGAYEDDRLVLYSNDVHREHPVLAIPGLVDDLVTPGGEEHRSCLVDLGDKAFHGVMNFHFVLRLAPVACFVPCRTQGARVHARGQSETVHGQTDHRRVSFLICFRGHDASLLSRKEIRKVSRPLHA